jgi:hypothetical protein
LRTVRQVSDEFLLNMAEVSATLIGLFLVGVFFYAETGLRRLGRALELATPYFRAGTRIVLVIYAIPLGVSLTLVVMDLVWSRVLYAFLSLVVVAANIYTAIRIRPATRAIRSTPLLVNEVVGTIATVVLVVIPWLLGGLHPSREDLTWGILVAFAGGFMSVVAVVLSVFDFAMIDETNR